MTTTYFDSASRDRRNYALVRLFTLDRETWNERLALGELSQWEKDHYATRVSLGERLVKEPVA